jgi:predicted aspartyl protease
MAISLAAMGSPANGDLAERVTVPFALEDGHMFVSVFVNGKGPFRFAFDTGASGVGRADHSLADALSLPSVAEAANWDGIKVQSADVVSVESLRLGSVERRNVELISRDFNSGRKPGLQPIMGIIARDFFADRLVTIDYPARTIRFSDGGLRPGDPGVTAYSGSLSVPVCFAAGCFPARVDTGSSRTLVIPKELLRKLAATEPVPIGEALRTNSVANLYEMTLQEPVRVAGVTATNQKVLYAEPSDSVIVVGSDFLKDYVLTVDQRHGLLKISMPGD